VTTLQHTGGPGPPAGPQCSSHALSGEEGRWHEQLAACAASAAAGSCHHPLSALPVVLLCCLDNYLSAEQGTHTGWWWMCGKLQPASVWFRMCRRQVRVAKLPGVWQHVVTAPVETSVQELRTASSLMPVCAGSGQAGGVLRPSAAMSSKCYEVLASCTGFIFVQLTA
jgi:hypothetical protein